MTSFLFGWFSAVTRASEETYLFYVAPVFCKGLFINSSAGGAHARKYKTPQKPECALLCAHKKCD